MLTKKSSENLLDPKSVAHKTMTGSEAVRLFAGTLDETSAREMQQAIDDGCESVNELHNSRPNEGD